jgi:hypothetical protein
MKEHSNTLKLKVLIGAVSTASIGLVCLLALNGFTAILLFASTIYTIALFLALWIAIEQELLSFPFRTLLARGWMSALLVIISFPAGGLIFLSIFFGLTPRQFLDFDDHSNETFSRLDWFRNDTAMPLGIFLGALVVLISVGCAVRILIGSWPKRIWTASIVFSFTMVCIGKLFESVLNGILLFILLSSAIIGVLIGHWIESALEAAVAKTQPTTGPAGVKQ